MNNKYCDQFTNTMSYGKYFCIQLINEILEKQHLSSSYSLDSDYVKEELFDKNFKLYNDVVITKFQTWANYLEENKHTFVVTSDGQLYSKQYIGNIIEKSVINLLKSENFNPYGGSVPNEKLNYFLKTIDTNLANILLYFFCSWYNFYKNSNKLVIFLTRKNSLNVRIKDNKTYMFSDHMKLVNTMYVDAMILKQTVLILSSGESRKKSFDDIRNSLKNNFVLYSHNDFIFNYNDITKKPLHINFLKIINKIINHRGNIKKILQKNPELFKFDSDNCILLE